MFFVENIYVSNQGFPESFEKKIKAYFGSWDYKKLTFYWYTFMHWSSVNPFGISKVLCFVNPGSYFEEVYIKPGIPCMPWDIKMCTVWHEQKQYCRNICTNFSFHNKEIFKELMCWSDLSNLKNSHCYQSSFVCESFMMTILQWHAIGTNFNIHF